MNPPRRLPPAPGETPPSDAEIHDHLIAAVMDQRLPPGTKLVEDRLGQVYGVSRTRIRQVLIRLAQAQVVVLSHNRGASIARPDADEAREVFEVRRLVEPTLLARAAARATAADLAALEALIAQEEQARRDGLRPQALRLSGEFHLKLAQIAGHRTLERLLRELVSRTSLILMAHGSAETAPEAGAWAPADGAAVDEHAGRPLRWRDACSCRDHRGLLEAMRSGDVDGGQVLMRRHLQVLQDALRFDAPVLAETDLVALLCGPSQPQLV